MNSVLQQLYMVDSIRVGLLAADGAATDINEDFSGEERLEGEVSEWWWNVNNVSLHQWARLKTI